MEKKEKEEMKMQDMNFQYCCSDGRLEIPMKDVFELFEDGPNSYLMEEWSSDMDEEEEELVYLSEVDENDLDDDGKLRDSFSDEPWDYISGRTYAVSDCRNTVTAGYVYKKEPKSCETPNAMPKISD